MEHPRQRKPFPAKEEIAALNDLAEKLDPEYYADTLRIIAERKEVLLKETPATILADIRYFLKQVLNRLDELTPDDLKEK